MINTNPVSDERINHFKEVLATSNVQEKNRVQKIFEEALGDISSDDCCIFLTGSHGRKEKIGQVKLEMIVVFKSDLSEEQKTLVKVKIENIINEHKNEFDEEIEYQTLGSNTRVIEHGKKIIPTRAFDSMRIWGSKIIKKDYYASMFSQISSLNNKDYTSFSKNFRQSTIRQLNEVVKQPNENKENQNEINKPFDLKTGILFYDGNKNRSSKFPFLRTVQYQMAHMIFQQIRSKKMSEAQANELRKQRTVPKKLEWMLKNKFINMSGDELKNLANAYTISLIWYESSEKIFHQGSKEMQVDLNQLKDLTNIISKFAKNQ